MSTNKETQNTITGGFRKLSSFFLLAAAGVVLAINFRNLPPEVPWFYSLPWGEQQLVPKLWFSAGLIFLSIFNVINLVITQALEKKDDVVPKVIWGANILITILYLASFLKVIEMVLIK